MILESFFLSNKITPVWINCHYNWGRYDEELEKWADSLASRTQKAHVLRRWMMERGTAGAAASEGGLPASSNDPDNVVK